jgi:phosphoribosyl 1,2-cyclic phosphodiesterase
MKIKFWGTRGSIPVPGKDTTIYGGNTTCLELNLESGRTIIVDAGTGIRLLGEKLLSQDKSHDILLLITHIHWDHIIGFPFFNPIHSASVKIRVDGHKNCMKGLRHAFDNKMGDGFFPITFEDLKADIEYLDAIKKSPLEIDDVIIEAIPLHHPQGGYGFRFREGDKSLVFITDNELRGEDWEGRRPKDYIRFCEGADILIHDCQYTPEEIDQRKGWGHSDYKSALDLAEKAGVKELFLFHHDPPRKDPEIKSMNILCQDLAKKKKSSIKIEAAREESEIIL